jgi:CMP-N-acetylneuraminic acid synthetase/spore coat polysaccharide biosynthesis predicted glycosyltransferase SpsG
MDKTIVIIPARGGSKGIPRKNIRPLAGKPLIYYAIKKALDAFEDAYIVVSSEDEEILSAAQLFGANIFKRNPILSKDETTLDPVIYETLIKTEVKLGQKFDIVITMQPTSPLLKVDSLKSAFYQISSSDADTIISATDDTHLTWTKKADTFYPNYAARVNRQQLPRVFKESGGFLMSKRKFVKENSRIGNQIQLFELNNEEGIDIDNFLDWNLCEFLLKQKSILFVVRGDSQIGLGHVYNCLNIADEILNHEIQFLVPKNNDLPLDRIQKSNYKVSQQKSEQLIDDINACSPDLIINDILDTDLEYMLVLKKRGYQVINFEDLGAGARKADLVINAMYPERKSYDNHYFGHKYFSIKSEFLHHKPASFQNEVSEIVIAFGGVDPCNLTRRTLEEIYEWSIERRIKLRVILGLGYAKKEEIYRDFAKAIIHENVPNMAALLSSAQIGITSAGRTTFEVASLNIPTIVLCQNDRETTHLFASKENGFINLGLGTNLLFGSILEEVKKLTLIKEIRARLADQMSKSEIREGKSRVLKLINDLL